MHLWAAEHAVDEEQMLTSGISMDAGGALDGRPLSAGFHGKGRPFLYKSRREFEADQVGHAWLRRARTGTPPAGVVLCPSARSR